MSSRIDRIPETQLAVKARDAAYQPATFAALCHLSLRQLERIFFAKRHESPRAWLDNIRLHDAKEGLVQGEFVKVVALQVGFSQSKHFSRWYRRLTGVNPSEPVPVNGTCQKMSLLGDKCRVEGVQYRCRQNGKGDKSEALVSRQREERNRNERSEP